MRRYIRLRLPDWLLCTLAAAGLLVNLYNGYDMKDALSGNLPVILLIAALLEAGIFLSTYSRKTTRISAAVMAAALVVIVIFMNLFHPFRSEQDSSLQIFWIFMILICLGVYWISRTRNGSIVLFAAGNLVLATEVFLKFGLILPGYVLFLCGTAALIFLRVYMRSVGDAAAGSVQLGRYAGQIVATCAAAALAGALCFVLIVQPLHPPTHELKLITRLQSMEQVQKIGVTSILSEVNYQRQNRDKTTDERKADKKKTDKKNDTNSQKKETSKKQDTKKKNTSKKKNNAQAKSGGKNRSAVKKKQRKANAVKYTTLHLDWLYAIILIAAGILASVFLKRYQRRRWFREISRLPYEQRIEEMYHFFLRTLDKARVKKKQSLSIREFAKTNRKFIEPYIYGDVDFQELTAIYEKVHFGGVKVRKADWDKFYEVYQEFYQNIRDEYGRWRYILLFYRI